MKTFSALVASLALATAAAAPAFAEETKTVPLNTTVSTQAETAVVAGGLGATGGALVGIAMAAAVVAVGASSGTD
jgi:hypothetical protein